MDFVKVVKSITKFLIAITISPFLAMVLLAFLALALIWH
jgi:hypothetical protein